MMSLERYTDLVLNLLNRLGVRATANGLTAIGDDRTTLDSIAHGHMKGRDPAKLAEAIARKVRS